MPDFVLTAKDGTRHRITAPDEAAARKMLAGQQGAGGATKEEAAGFQSAVGLGLRNLIEGLISFPGMLADAKFSAAEGVARLLNAPEYRFDDLKKARQTRSVPTVEEVAAATTKVMGPPYKPKNTAEEYVATAAEFLPGLLVGGGPIRKGIQWLLPAFLSETGGQIARRTIPQYEPHVRFGLGLGAELLPGGILRMSTGPHALRAPGRAGTLQPQSAPDAVRQMTEGEGTRHAVGGPIEGNPGANAEQQGTFPQIDPERSGIDADMASPIVMRQASIVEDSGTNAVRQVHGGPMTSRAVEGVGFVPAQPQQSFLSVSPDSKLARILGEGVQPSVPHSPIPRDHPARGVPRVSDLVGNKPGAIVDRQGNALTGTVPDRAGIGADAASPMVMREAAVVEDKATSAAQRALLETMTPRVGNSALSLPAQPREGIASASPPDELAGLFREGVQPNVPQTPIPRYDPPRGVSPRVADLIVNPDVRQKVIETIDRGIRMGGLDWYNAEPLRLAFIDELGEFEGTNRFDHFMDLIAATSARSRVPENVRNASYYLTLGGQMPEKNPQPYGHLAQKMHRRNVERVWSGGLDPLTHAKSVSMGANAKGNYLPVTIDMHAYRLLAMLSGDPRFLATFVPTKSGVPRNIRKEFTTGLIGPDELRDPNFWLPQPARNEYAALERYFQEIARELGLTPAQVQAAAWVGGSELTGLRSDPGKNLLGFFKDRLLLTANDKEMTPRDVLRQLIRAELPLIALGGVALAPQFLPREEGPSGAPSAAP